MPRIKKIDYVLTGPADVKIYAQEEMAHALGISEARLIEEIGKGIGLGYHAHPLATGSGYWFTTSVYQNNIRVWRCYQDGGHDMQPDPKYNYLPAGASTCSRCGYTVYH